MAQSLYPSFTPTYHHDQYPAIDPSVPSLSCAGKIVLITGGGCGIGKANSLAIAKAHVAGAALLSRTQASLDGTASEIRTLTNSETEVFVYAVDVLDQAGVQAALEATIIHFDGRVPDVLVNNAGGLHGVGPLIDVDLANSWQTFGSNVRGPMIVTPTYLRANRQYLLNPAKTAIKIPSGAAHPPYASGAAAYGC